MDLESVVVSLESLIEDRDKYEDHCKIYTCAISSCVSQLSVLNSDLLISSVMGKRISFVSSQAKIVKKIETTLHVLNDLVTIYRGYLDNHSEDADYTMTIPTSVDILRAQLVPYSNIVSEERMAPELGYMTTLMGFSNPDESTEIDDQKTYEMIFGQIVKNVEERLLSHYREKEEQTSPRSTKAVSDEIIEFTADTSPPDDDIRLLSLATPEEMSLDKNERSDVQEEQKTE